MFAKLLKYEWKASAGLLGILSGAVLGIGLAAGFALRSLIELTKSVADNTGNTLGMVPLGFFLIFAILALVIYGFAVQIILLSRFYKSRFTDEGYLTFTLPVSTWENYLSSLVHMQIWNLISMVTIFVAVVMMLLVGLSGMGNALQAMFGTYGDVYQDTLVEDGYGLYMGVNLLYTVVSFFTAPALMMTSITLGAVLAKKHKILAAIGVYYLMSMAIGFLTSFSSVLLTLNGAGMLTSEYYTALAASAGWQTLVLIALSVGGSFLSVWLMNRKLNLP